MTFIALLLWRFGRVWDPDAPAIVVVGGILLLLPTGRLVSSVQDAINGFPVTAAGRFLSTHADLRRARGRHRRRLRGGDMTGMEPIDVTKHSRRRIRLWVLVILIAIAVVAIGITEQTSWGCCSRRRPWA